MGIEKGSYASGDGREKPRENTIGKEVGSPKQDIVSFSPLTKNKEKNEPKRGSFEPPSSFPPVEKELNRLRGENVVITPEAVSQSGANPEAEYKKTKLSTDLVVDAYYGDMKRFPHLTEKEQEELHQEVKNLGSEQRLKTLYYRLSTHDIFKDKEAHHLTGIGEDVDHDEVYKRVITEPRYEKVRRELMPGFDSLPQEEQEFLQKTCEARSDYAQILQGQAPAAVFEPMHNEPDPQVRDFNILEAKFDIFGASGHINQDVSLFATSSTVRKMKNLDKAFRDPTLKTIEERRNAFRDSEIAYFKGPVQPKNEQELSDLRTLADLELHFRVDSQEKFDRLEESFNKQHELVKSLLGGEMNRDVHPTLADYGPALVRTIAEKEGEAYALTYYAHVLQEAHIADKEARKAGIEGISQVQLDEFVKSIKRDEIDLKKTTMRFEPRSNALVAVPREPTLVDISDIPEFTGGEALRGKRVLVVGIGGGSDGSNGDDEGKILSEKYGAEVVAVGSVRGDSRQLVNTGEQIGRVTKEITPETRAVGDWRFLEHLNKTPTYVLNSADPEIVKNDLEALIDATGATTVVAVDTGGDSLYKTLHAGFSSHLPTEITPDQDYEVIKSLAEVAKEREDVTMYSTIMYPGVDTPPYAREILAAAEAKRLPLNDNDKNTLKGSLAEKRMDGSGSEDGIYGKTPLAGLHALNENYGVQLLRLPKANLTSVDNPWRGFLMVTPAMGEIVIMDLQKHYDAIKRPHESE